MADMKRFEGKSVIITGAASGIGAATARRFAQEGAKLVLGDQDGDKLAAVAKELETTGTEVATLVGDVAVQADVDALIALSEQRFGGLDVLVNNAGIGSFGKVTDMDAEQWKRVIEVDLHSVFYGCKAAIPVMRNGGGGVIVNMASVSGMFADYGLSCYNAAKGAVVNYTRAVAMDHAAEGIRVNAVCPGLIATALSSGILALDGFEDAAISQIPMGRTGHADEVAGCVLFLASDDASYVTGTTLVVDGGVTAGTGQVNFTRVIEKALANRST